MTSFLIAIASMTPQEAFAASQKKVVKKKPVTKKKVVKIEEDEEEDYVPPKKTATKKKTPVKKVVKKKVEVDEEEEDDEEEVKPKKKTTKKKDTSIFGKLLDTGSELAKIGAKAGAKIGSKYIDIDIQNKKMEAEKKRKQALLCEELEANIDETTLKQVPALMKKLTENKCPKDIKLALQDRATTLFLEEGELVPSALMTKLSFLKKAATDAGYKITKTTEGSKAVNKEEEEEGSEEETSGKKPFEKLPEPKKIEICETKLAQLNLKRTLNDPNLVKYNKFMNDEVVEKCEDFEPKSGEPGPYEKWENRICKAFRDRKIDILPKNLATTDCLNLLKGEMIGINPLKDEKKVTIGYTHADEQESGNNERENNNRSGGNDNKGDKCKGKVGADLFYCQNQR